MARRGLTAVAAGSPGEKHGGREAGGGWTRLGCGGAGGAATGGSPVPLPQPGPGPPADSAPRRPLPRPRPGLTVREAAPEEAAGEGTAAGGAAERLRLQPAAPGRRVLAEAAEDSGFNAQRLRGEESTAHARCGQRCHSGRGGAGAPAVS